MISFKKHFYLTNYFDLLLMGAGGLFSAALVFLDKVPVDLGFKVWFTMLIAPMALLGLAVRFTRFRAVPEQWLLTEDALTIGHHTRLLQDFDELCFMVDAGRVKLEFMTRDKVKFTSRYDYIPDTDIAFQDAVIAALFAHPLMKELPQPKPKSARVLLLKTW